MPSEAHAAYTFPRMFGLEAMPPLLVDLLPIARGWKPDLMIHEPAELAAPLVAALTGTRLVTHAWGAPVSPGIPEAAADVLAPYWLEHGHGGPAEIAAMPSSRTTAHVLTG